MSVNMQNPSGVADQFSLRRSRLTKMAMIWGLVLLFIAWCVQGTIIEDTDWDRIGGRNGVLASISRYFWLD